MTEVSEQIVETKKVAEKELKDLFNQKVINFKLRWINKGSPISQAGLYNYAMSLMRYEFNKIFDKETSEKLVDFYKP